MRNSLLALSFFLAIGCGAASHNGAEEPSSDPAPRAEPDPIAENPCEPGDRYDECAGDPSCPECDVCAQTCYTSDGVAYAPGNPPDGATAGPGSCQSDADCAEGERCDECASSSCPMCDDCVAACVAR